MMREICQAEVMGHGRTVRLNMDISSYQNPIIEEQLMLSKTMTYSLVGSGGDVGAGFGIWDLCSRATSQLSVVLLPLRLGFRSEPKSRTKAIRFTITRSCGSISKGRFESITMPFFCCNKFKLQCKHRVRDYSFDNSAPRMRTVEPRPGESSNPCYYPGVDSGLPRSGTVGLPRSLTTSWLQENASTKDVVKSLQTQKSLVYTTQDRQNSMRDKKVS